MHEKILIVDDEQGVLMGLRMSLENEYLVDTVRNGSAAMASLAEHNHDLVLLDIGLPEVSGLEILKKIKSDAPETLVIMITAVDDVKTVVKALKSGAYDYLVKPLGVQEVKVTVRNALESKKLKDRIRRIQQPNIDRYNIDLIGQSPEIKTVMEIGRIVATSPTTPLLIVGESGTGKTLMAKAVHYTSGNPPGPLVKINCTAVNSELFESEFFGYERGAFTGARSDGKKGHFEQADGGTIFLDEIGSMPLEVQAKFLGVLEDSTFFRVGSSKPIVVSARIIAATNKDLEEAVAGGAFRQDLFYRLNVVKIEMPPLRDRKEDIILLAEHFVEAYSLKFGKPCPKISREAEKKLLAYHWPGNVRELRNMIERIMIFQTGEVLLAEHITSSGDGQMAPGQSVDFSSTALDYEATIKSLLEEALKRTGNNVLEAARLLKIPQHKIRYRMKKYGLR